MSKKMLINATHPEEHRVAIVEDGILSELDIEITGKEQTKGNIYKAVVVRVETGLQAAFVDYGGERPGFLQIGEIHPSFHKTEPNSDSKGRPRINDMLRRGQELLVQVVKEERGTKGAALTTYLSLPGRYMVLMPESDTKGVSRKIEQESVRKKLKEAMNSLELPDSVGYIVRTAGIGQKKAELKRDVDYLLRVYEKILEHSKQVKAPALVYKESNLVIRSIRDYFSPDIDEVLVDDPRAAQEGKDFFEEVMPEYAQLVKLHQERRPIFSRYQIEEQIEGLTRNKVPLPSGGSIVIDTTEALVAIDVNSGKMASEKGVEATAFKSNMEAAAEAARQLRLRDLGGLIVIDFIDMRDRKHIRDVEKCLKDALKNDKARVSVGRISQFGLLEMSRQRIKAALAEASYLPCPHCEGSGRVKSAEAQALSFLRRLSAGMAKGQIGRVEGQVPLDVAAYLLNNKRAELVKIEQQYNALIHIHGRPDYVNGQIEVEFLRREKEEQKAIQQYVEASSVRVESPPETATEEEPQTEEAPADQPVQAEGEEGARPSGRKRRRPRRRRKSSDAAVDKAVEAAPEEPEEDSAPPPEESPTPKPDSAAAPPATDVEKSVAADAASSRSEAAPDAIGDAQLPQAADTEPPAAEEPAAVKPRPKPRARRRKPASSKAAAAPAATVPAPPVPPTEPAPPQPPAESPAPEPAKAQTPRSRTASAPSEAVSEAEAPQPTAEPVAPAADKPEAGAVAEEKPKRRRTRKPAAKKPVEKAVAAAAKPAAAETTNTDSAADEAKKPARRGRPRKKPAAKPEPAQEGPAGGETKSE